MRREIKFRAWSHGGGDPRIESEMYYSGEYNLTSDMMKKFVSLFGVIKTDPATFTETIDNFDDYFDKSQVHIMSKEIYEGDIYKKEVLLVPKGMTTASNVTYWVEVECVVCFENGSFVGRYSIDNEEFLKEGTVKINNIEITSNIYENPEILGNA